MSTYNTFSFIRNGKQKQHEREVSVTSYLVRFLSEGKAIYRASNSEGSSPTLLSDVLAFCKQSSKISNSYSTNSSFGTSPRVDIRKIFYSMHFEGCGKVIFLHCLSVHWGGGGGGTPLVSGSFPGGRGETLVLTLVLFLLGQGYPLSWLGRGDGLLSG